MSAAVAFIICIILTPAVIKAAGRFNSPIKEELLVTQSQKKGTCTLGSLPLYLSFAAGCLLSGSGNIRIVALVTPFFLIGLADDILKFIRHSSDGFSSIVKLILQLASSCYIACVVRADYIAISPYIYYPVSVVFITAVVNAVNITDGLDSLAVKVSMPVVLLFAIIAPLVRDANLVMIACLSAFLIFNSKKASIFMGDGGSHLIGSFLALDAMLSGNIIVFIISSAVFFAELASSFIQIVSIRCFRRKVFRIAPLHHDLEQHNLGEEKIADIFFSISVFSALVSAMLFFEGGLR